MKNFIAAIAVAIFMVGTMNVTTAQTVSTTVNEGTAVDLADTTADNAAAVKAAKDFTGKYGDDHPYGTTVEIPVVSGDSIVVQEFANVKSRNGGKLETQWGVSKYKNGKLYAGYVLSEADPTDELTDKASCLTTANGCGVNGSTKFSAKWGDGVDGAISDLE